MAEVGSAGSGDTPVSLYTGSREKKKAKLCSDTTSTATVAVVEEKKAKTEKPVWHFGAFNKMSRQKQQSALPFCMAENITLKEFHAKIDRKETSSVATFRLEYKDGKAWIYELPHTAHEGAAGILLMVLTDGLGARKFSFRLSPAPRCDTNNDSMEPDGSLVIRNCGRPGPGSAHAADAEGNRFPSIIVEVARCETEPHVRAKALTWLAASNAQFGVQQVIVIKIGEKTRKDGHYTMKAMRYERGANNKPVQEIEFGNHGPNHGATALGCVGMQLLIPMTSIFHPVAVPAALGPNLILDLFHI